MLVAGVAIAAVLVAAAVVIYTWRVRTHGRIKAIGVGVYYDAACTQEVSEIDWGTLAPMWTSFMKALLMRLVPILLLRKSELLGVLMIVQLGITSYCCEM